jgi:uncharacterized lipoprotein YajG|tara:strand:+ start:2348 stop:2497 length:150 start_codon:yes stop_codon:yes gene_type:complete
VNRQSAGSQYLAKKKSEKDMLGQMHQQQDVRQFLQQPIEDQMIVDQQVP